MSDIDPDLPERDPRSVEFELTYWQELNRLLMPTHELIAAAAGHVIDVSVSLLFLLTLPEQSEQHTKSLTEAVSANLDDLRSIQELVEQIGELVNGRLSAIEREMPRP